MAKPDATRACDDGLAEWRSERVWIAEANRLYRQGGCAYVLFGPSDYRRAGDVTPQEYMEEVTQDGRAADYRDDLPPNVASPSTRMRR